MKVLLHNRYCKVSTSEHLGCPRRNDPTDALCALYRQWRGYGLIITGNVMIDRRALEAPRNVVLDQTTNKKRMRAWAQACGDQLVLVQLSHPGRQSPLANSWNKPLAPCSKVLKLSGVGVQLHRTPRVVTAKEISEIITMFGISTRLAREAGFSGIQIHAAHGYFLSHCLSLGMIQVLFDTIDIVLKNLHAGILSVKINALQEKIDTVSLIRQLGAKGVDIIELSPGGSYSTGMRCLGDPRDFGAKLFDPIPIVLENFFSTNVSENTSALLVSGDMHTQHHVLLKRYPHLLIGFGRAACVCPDLSRLLVAAQNNTLPKPPQFFRSLTDRMPVALRRIFIPGLRFGWYQRQLKRIAYGKAVQPKQGHALYLLFVFPRALFFEPARLFAHPYSWQTSVFGWGLLLLLLSRCLLTLRLFALLRGAAGDSEILLLLVYGSYAKKHIERKN